VLHALSKGKFFVDEVYDRLLVRPLRWVATVLWQGVDDSLIDQLGVGGTAGAVGFAGDVVRGWHNGRVRRYLVTLLFGVMVVLGSVYCNPRVSQVGPNVLNPTDPGGIRPEIGGVPVDWSGFWYGDAPAPPMPPPKAGGRPVHDPVRAPSLGPGGPIGGSR
jgi:hypothetical protein